MNYETMGRKELREHAKAAGIKYGKLSLMQIRDALKSAKRVAKNDKVRAKQTGTKIEAALKIIEDNSDKSRKEILALFVTKAKLTKAGANTYYSLCQKKLKTK